MSQEPPPPPPPAFAPLDYATPNPAAVTTTNSWFHGAAKASLAAPLIGIALNLVTRPLRTDSPAAAGVAGLVATGLILIGLVCAVVAFFGVRRYGSKGIVGRAVVGLLLNGVLVLAMLSFLFTARQRVAARVAAARAAAVPPAAPMTSAQSSLRGVGWLGTGEAGPFTVTLIAMDRDHADTRRLRGLLSRDCDVLVLTMDNEDGQDPVTVDTRDATFKFADGRTTTALDIGTTMSAAVKREVMMPPFTVAAGTYVDHKALLAPRIADWSELQSIRIIVNGRPVDVSGRVWTADEKSRMLE